MNILTLIGSSTDYSSLLATLLAFGMVFLFITIAVVILIFVVLWKLFTKAGIEGWKCLIPYYNSILLSKIATGNSTIGIISIVLSVCSSAASRTLRYMGDDTFSALMLTALSGFISLGALVIYAILCYKLAQAFNGGTARCVCAIFFGYFALIGPAFDKTGRYRYVGPLADPNDDINYAHYSSSGYGPGGYNNYNSYNNNYNSNNNNNYGSVNNGNTYGSSTNNAGYSYPSPNNNNGQMDGIDTSSVNLNKDDNNNY